MAGKLTPYQEAEALCTHAVCALLEGKGGCPAWWRHNTADASPAKHASTNVDAANASSAKRATTHRPLHRGPGSGPQQPKQVLTLETSINAKIGRNDSIDALSASLKPERALSHTRLNRGYAVAVQPESMQHLWSAACTEFDTRVITGAAKALTSRPQV